MRAVIYCPSCGSRLVVTQKGLVIRFVCVVCKDKEKRDAQESQRV